MARQPENKRCDPQHPTEEQLRFIADLLNLNRGQVGHEAAKLHRRFKNLFPGFRATPAVFFGPRDELNDPCETPWSEYGAGQDGLAVIQVMAKLWIDCLVGGYEVTLPTAPLRFVRVSSHLGDGGTFKLEELDRSNDEETDFLGGFLAPMLLGVQPLPFSSCVACDTVILRPPAGTTFCGSEWCLARMRERFLRGAADDGVKCDRGDWAKIERVLASKGDSVASYLVDHHFLGAREEAAA